MLDLRSTKLLLQQQSDLPGKLTKEGNHLICGSHDSNVFRVFSLLSIELKDKKDSYGELEKQATQKHQLFQSIKQKLAAKKREAESIAPIEDKDGNSLPLKDELSALEVNDLTEVDAAIEDIERSIEGIHENRDAVRQYEKLRDEIEKLKGQLDEVKNSRETRQSKLQKMLQPWESKLDSSVAKINALFTHYMGEMGCTGEVRLKKGISDEGTIGKGNFKDWGIEILVSFREGAKAQVLSAERHSGGERSVSTIMYLMALQDLMTAPFRCVDEINQGLDDRNERLVFKRIVENSTRIPQQNPSNHSGQYFLITPKLLPNLTDMEEEDVTILFVFNGKSTDFYDRMSVMNLMLNSLAKFLSIPPTGVYNFKSPNECDFASLAVRESKRPALPLQTNEETTTASPDKAKRRRKS